MAEFSMETCSGSDLCTVRVAGEVDLACSGKLRAVGRLGVASGAHTIKVDLRDVTFLDSTGLGALVHIRNATRERHKQLVLSRPSAQVSSVLALAGLDAVFTIEGEPAQPGSL
jgi:anti-sigma B factor antagonist